MTGRIFRVIKLGAFFGLVCTILLGLRPIDGTEGQGNDKSINTSNYASVVSENRAEREKITPSDFLDDLPICPVAVGEPFTVSNAFFEVTLSSNKYIHFGDLQILFMWATVKNLGGREDKFTFELISKVPPGWSSVDDQGGYIWLNPGKEDDIKFMCTSVYTGTKKKTSTFMYRVTSKIRNKSLTFSFKVKAYPQMSDHTQIKSTSVAGTVTDAATGNPISGAEVTLWLGCTKDVMPFDMVDETDSTGAYNIVCRDVDEFNKDHKPYISVKGFRLVAQKEGYKTYVHNQYVKPTEKNPITQNIRLTPLAEQVDYELKWETALWSPGVWLIKVTDAWDRFAVALGKHPDPIDPDKLPTKIPFIDNKGKILWKKKIHDESWAIDVTRDGSYIACATTSDGPGNKNYCYLWDAAGNQIWEKPMPSEAYDIKFSHDGQSIATGPSKKGAPLILYDTLTGAKKWDHDMGGGGIRMARQTAFTRNGKYVLAGKILHLYTSGGRLVWRRYHPYVPYAIWPSSNGKLILVPDKGDCLSMFNIKGKLMWRREQRVITYGVMSANASVSVITTTHGYVFCYDKKGRIKWYHFIPGCQGTTGHNSAGISPDGKYIIVGGGPYSTVLYDSNGNLLWRHTNSTPYDPEKDGMKQSVMSVRISSDGKKIAIGYGTEDPKLCYFEKIEK